MTKFTVTLTLRDKEDSHEGVDIGAKIHPMPTEEEMAESPSIQLLHEFLDSLNDSGEVLSAKVAFRQGDKTLLEQDLKP